jgi:hypothetical protein
MKQFKGKKRLYIAIVLILVVGLYVLYALVALLGGNESAYKTESLSLREILGNASFNSVALVDAVTPMPSMEGKQILFVDGLFYVDANLSVTDYIRSVVNSGVPAVIFEEGYDSFRISINGTLPSEKARYAYNDSNVIDAQIAAYGLKLYPQDTVYGMPVADMIEIAGSSERTANVASLALEWASTKLSNETPLPFEITRQQLVPATSTQWIQACQLTFCTGDDWYDYGRLNIRKTWYKLSEIDNNSCNFSTMSIVVEVFPGSKTFGNGWRNADAWATVDGYKNNSVYVLVDYAPTTSYLSFDKRGRLSHDVVVHDLSDFSEGRIAWWYDINDNGNVGMDACPIMSWFTYRLDGEPAGGLIQRYQSQYSKTTVWPWPWTFWESPVITIETSS